MVTYYKGKIAKEDIEFGTGTFIRYNSALGSVQKNQVNRGDIPRKILIKTADFVITSEVGEVIFTNEGASGTITFFLPVQGPLYLTLLFLSSSIDICSYLLVSLFNFPILYQDFLLGDVPRLSFLSFRKAQMQQRLHKPQCHTRAFLLLRVPKLLCLSHCHS